jgi:ABC-type bacteriocin/lantibiotic exporter with double-glycine peptidase domain
MPSATGPVTRLWKLLRHEKSDITAIYFFAILSGLIQLSLPLGIQAIIGFVISGTLSASLVVLIAVLVIGVLFAGIMQINQMQIIERIQQRIFVRYAFAFADRIPRLDLLQADTYYLPELMNRFFDATALQKGVSKLLLDLPTAMIQILFGLILLSFYHPLFILFGLVLLFLLWGILYVTGNKGLESSLSESTYKYDVAGWFEEMARLVKTFKFSYTSGLHQKKSDEKTINYLQARTKHFGVLLLQYKTLVFFKVATTLAMLVVAVILLLNQQINIGQFVAAEIVILLLIASVEKIIINLDSVYDVLTAVEKIEKVTDKAIDASGQYSLDASSELSIEAKDLTFSYEGDRQILKGVSFKIASGETACITGSDGSGKSTLLKLLTGLYKDFSGALLINGIPIGNYDNDLLREKTGIFFSNENIFNGTLWENITMGKSNVDEAHITMLSNKLGLHAFLSTLPLGYDTYLDPTGKRLPGNVIQKILLIRALAHKPRLLVMEEPWLDIEEQYKAGIQDLVLGLKETTVIVVSRDEAFAKQCNQIINLGG